MTKTALNMLVRLLFAELYSLGYTYRLFHPGWVCSYMQGKKSEWGKVEPEVCGKKDYEKLLQDRSMEAESHRHSDEKRLVMHNRYECQILW